MKQNRDISSGMCLLRSLRHESVSNVTQHHLWLRPRRPAVWLLPVMLSRKDWLCSSSPHELNGTWLHFSIFLRVFTRSASSYIISVKKDCPLMKDCFLNNKPPNYQQSSTASYIDLSEQEFNDFFILKMFKLVS